MLYRMGYPRPLYHGEEASPHPRRGLPGDVCDDKMALNRTLRRRYESSSAGPRLTSRMSRNLRPTGLIRP
jgi:hypothetical protein